MQIKELIRRKRDGGSTSSAEIDALVMGYVRGEIKDYQIAAWLMAVYFKGLSSEETAALTRSMWHSGSSFPRKHREDFWVDKHSTGGIGDKTSLILVPLVVAAAHRLFGKGNLRIPMVSGRGLAHTAGTLDKLEAVPGFSSNITLEKALQLIDENDFFMMGQTPELAPADRLIYALRDVTATVENLSLIVASIMSKKCAESLDGLVFDVKTGTGAFMKTVEEAREMARDLLSVSKAQGLDAVAVVSRMDEPLGLKVGHHLEIEECADFLLGLPRDKGLDEVTFKLAAWMIHLGSRHRLSLADAEAECRRELGSTTAYTLFKKMFAAQGGKWDAFERQRDQLRKTLRIFSFTAAADGFLERIEARALGVLLNALGGGRNSKEDVIDPLVGIELLHKVGDEVKAGEKILIVYYRRDEQKALIETSLKEAVRVGNEPVIQVPYVVECLL